MSFTQSDILSFQNLQDSWQNPDNLVSPETSTSLPGTIKVHEPLSPSIMDPTMDSWSPFPSNGLSQSQDFSFQAFGQEQFSGASQGTHNARPHLQGNMIESNQGLNGQRFTPSYPQSLDWPHMRRIGNSREAPKEPPPKRKRMDAKSTRYGFQKHHASEGSSGYRDGPTCDEDCKSDTGSAASCCSNCTEGPPCEDPHCAIPCAEPSCEIPICADDCPDVCPGVQAQQVQVQPGFNAALLRVSVQHSLGEPWNPISSADYLPATERYRHVDPALPGPCSDSQYQQEHEPSNPPTPSMAQNMATPYSPEAPLHTPQISGQLPQRSYINETHTIVGAGGMFPPPANGEWGASNFADPSTSAWMLDCPWDACNTVVPNEQFWTHLHQEHLDPQYNYGCPIQPNGCQKSVENPLIHLQTEHGFDMNECFSCPAPTCSPAETYNNQAMFHNHFDLTHATPAQGFLQCRLDSCNNSFVDPNQLLSHIQTTHQVLMPLAKNAIGTEAPNYPPTIAESETLISHTCKWKHQGDVLCDKVFANERDLQDHVKATHLALLSKSTGYICQWDNCNRPAKMGSKQGFSQRGKLERHMASHTNFKCSECDICHQLFSAEQAMKQHRLLHTGEKPWKCKFCPKRFPQQSACTIHERTHTKDKPLVCEICKKKFSESSNFAKHRRIHGELGKHACEFPGCGKTFHRSDQLKKHMKMHSKTSDIPGKSEECSSEEGSDRGVSR